MSTVLAYDTTLRDGAQGPGISFSPEDMIAVARRLDAVGMDFIELGNPGARPADLHAMQALARAGGLRARLTAFGMTCRAGGRAQDDDGLARLCDSGASWAALVGKSSMLHVERVLRVEARTALRMISDSVRCVRGRGLRVIFDAEHFFDGWVWDAPFAMASLAAAADAGAEGLALCDTNGGTMPWRIAEIVAAVCDAYPDIVIHFHGHNDAGMATASSLEAVRAGARAVQGTMGGLGERCGNADLCEVLPNLALKMGRCVLGEGGVARLGETMRAVFEILNLTPDEAKPYVGAHAFAHKAGMHIDGVIKHSGAFEHVDPAEIGNRRRLILSALSGRGALLSHLEAISPGLDKDSPEVARLIAAIKDQEEGGLSYEGANASFALMVLRGMNRVAPHFTVEGFTVLSEMPGSPAGVAAMVKVVVGGRGEITAAEGEGPVNALDLALRKALCVFYPRLSELRLVDYKVRVLHSGSGTASRVRVLIRSSDGRRTWGTVGVSVNIIEASFRALCDAIEGYLLFCEGEPALGGDEDA